MAARKKRRANRARPNGSPESPYPADTPIEESTGMPKAEADIAAETAKRIGFDPTSARKKKQFRDVLEQRAGGVKNIKWNADPQLKYAQVVSVHPDAKVTVKQIEPHVDESLDDQSVKVLTDYGALRKYIKDNHWKGDKATYQFSFSSFSHPVIGEGKTYFNEDPEWAERKEEEMAARRNPQYGPQQQPNPQYGPQQQGGYPPPGYGGYPPQGYPPPGYGYPPPGYGPPQVTVVQPQHVPPMPQPAPMPAAPAPNAGMDVFVQYLIQQAEWSRQEQERLRAYAEQLQQKLQQQQPQQQQAASPQEWLAWVAAERKRWEDDQALKLAALAKPEPQAPADPLAQMKATVDMIKAVTSARESILGPTKEEPESKKSEDDDGFPVLVKKVGPLNIIADRKTGQIIQDPMMSAMFNAGNIEEVFKRVGEKAEKFFKDRTEANTAATEQQIELEKLKIRSAHERAEAMKTLADSQERINRAQQQVMSAPEPPKQMSPQAISQAHAEALAERPTVTVEPEPVVARPAHPPPPWRRAPVQEAPPAPVVSAGAAPGNGADEEPLGSGNTNPAQPPGAEETIPDTEPPPEPEPEPAADVSELQPN